jgi:hypothetical protein
LQGVLRVFQDLGASREVSLPNRPRASRAPGELFWPRGESSTIPWAVEP